MSQFGNQWDQCLHGALWVYRNTLHDATGGKPSFLLFMIDCKTRSEVAYLPSSTLCLAHVVDYREKLMLSLSSARQLAAANVRKAQIKYKRAYAKTCNCNSAPFKIGEWVLVRFLSDQSGSNRKFSRPWQGSYRAEVLICFEVWAKLTQQWLVCAPLGIQLSQELMLLVITQSVSSGPKREL